MRAEKTALTVHINLPKGFINKVKKVMENELSIASGKWGVTLTNGEKADLINHAMNQVQRKVNDNTRLVWDFSDVLNVRVNSPKNEELHIPDARLATHPKRLIKTKVGWEVDDESRDESIFLKDFHEHLQNLIFTWSRTAVFYGVGSYKD